MKGYRPVDNYKHIVTPLELSRRSGLPVKAAKAWLSNSKEVEALSEAMRWKFQDACGDCFYKIRKSIIRNRWWIQQYASCAHLTAADIADLLGRSRKTVKRWLSGDDSLLIDITADDLTELDKRFPLHLCPAWREAV